MDEMRHYFIDGLEIPLIPLLGPSGPQMAELEVGPGRRCGLYVTPVKFPSLTHFQFGHLRPVTDTEEEECLPPYPALDPSRVTR